MSLPKHGLLALVVGLAVPVIGATSTGCGKRGSGTNSPTDQQPDEAGAPRGKTVEIEYSDLPVQLTQRARVDFTTTGGGAYAQAALDVAMELSLRGGKDQIEVTWKIVGLDDVKLDGSLSGAAGEPDDYVRDQGLGAWLMSRRGIVDVRRSDAHPANAKRLAALAEVDQSVAQRRADGEGSVVPPPGAALVKLLPELLVLPRLPSGPLAIGASVESKEVHETALIGTDLVIPTETTVRYTLVNVQPGAGVRLAEVTFEAEDWGGLELEDGDVELSNQTDGTMLFDVDRGVPVNLSFTREESLVAGEISYDTTKIVTATFE